LVPVVVPDTSRDPLEIRTDASDLRKLAEILRDNDQLRFNYLISLFGIDWQDHFTLVYHFESTATGQSLIVKTDIPDHDHPEADTLSDLWKTAEYQEREVYDLMGVTFRNHPDLRRLFLEEGWDFPLRKDYRDEINFIER